MQMSSPFTTFAALAWLCTPSLASYILKDNYNAQNFFSMFDFWTDTDPTLGYVDYISQSAAQSAGLINTNNNQVYVGVDSKNVAWGRGRQSVRLTSKAAYNHGLILLDLEHMPGSICGAWPAFWTVGPNWPHSGEIDIIEGVNSQTHNSMTLHTDSGCSISSSNSKRTTNFNDASSGNAFLGAIVTPNCDVNAAGQSQNAGCSISTPATNTYGDGFNTIGGGVYATEWTSSLIRIWFFPRSQIPSDITNGVPIPNSWGTPQAYFSSTSCNIDAKFQNQQIVFDTTFCGAWAGAVWSSDGACSQKANSCQDFVQNNPGAFAEAYWKINSLNIYTDNGSIDQKSLASFTNTSWHAVDATSSAPVRDATGSLQTRWDASPEGSKHTWVARSVAEAETAPSSPSNPNFANAREELLQPEADSESVRMRKLRQQMSRHKRHIYRLGDGS